MLVTGESENGKFIFIKPLLTQSNNQKVTIVTENLESEFNFPDESIDQDQQGLVVSQDFTLENSNQNCISGLSGSLLPSDYSSSTISKSYFCFYKL